jgi:hypothetical protein
LGIGFVDLFSIHVVVSILLEIEFVGTHFLELVHFVAASLLGHFANHESPNLVIHDRHAIGVGFHVDDEVGFEIFDHWEDDLPHEFKDLEFKW